MTVASLVLSQAGGSVFLRLNSRNLMAVSGLRISCATPAASAKRRQFLLPRHFSPRFGQLQPQGRDHAR